MLVEFISLKLSTANAQEGYAIAVTWIYVRVNLENESTKFCFGWIYFSRLCFA
jgi:hypothetical protein